MNVTVYSTPNCGFCVKIKQYFKEKGVAFTEYDVAADREKAEEMVKKSGQMGVPVTDINGTIIVGYNRPKIDEALNL